MYIAIISLVYAVMKMPDILYTQLFMWITASMNMSRMTPLTIPLITPTTMSMTTPLTTPMNITL